MTQVDTRKAFEGEDYGSSGHPIDSAQVRAEAMKPSKSGNRLPLTGFVVLMLAGLLMCALAVFTGGAPVSSPYSEDWISWARIETIPSGLLVVGLAVILIGIVGCLFRLTVPVKRRSKVAAAVAPSGGDDFDLAIPETQLQMSGDGLKVASVHYLSTDTPDQTNRNRAALRFEAPPATTQAGLSQSQAPLATPSSHELIPHYGDNAADAFGLPKPHLSHPHLNNPQPRPAEFKPEAETPARPVVDTDVLSPEHGLHISGLRPKPASPAPEAMPEPPPTAQVIPLRPAPEPAPEVMQAPQEPIGSDPVATGSVALATESPLTAQERAPDSGFDSGPVVFTEPDPAPLPDTLSDPIAAALLAEAPETAVRDLPPSDINAVVTSAMRFIDTPAPAAHDAYAPVVPAPVTVQDQAPAPAAVAVPVLTPEEEIGQTVSTALSVWPDTTRPIAAEELSVRISYLYYDKSPQSREVFDLIAAGDLSVAASRLQGMANELMNAGAFAHSAELWRVYGALHMGRDDPKAMMAYEQVSELDPSDANIHLYLARRYQMDGRTDVLAPVIGRALAVVSDPQTRSGLLTQYADLKFKVGDLTTAATAFEELSLINESLAYLDPSNLQVRSGRGIALARLAQIREMQGEHLRAAPLYRKAHEVFAELSAQMPGHAGLKAMADNALRDVQRLGA
ncbi:hypothetical protein [Asticcacaulis machinosus]|uniref:Tetratricopeptide repeat-containing protein n=1 Tax=Asticcacaulis machinosus TaxID=2984211 RepID=A0ABT5HMV0_9CAUL|nr:hypothetical protein [Asticcacaulis machinosus]MDC7677548.1 hypothetical protein [Asticcacaulis machinosus]